MKIKNLILVFFALLIITGCAKSRPELSAQEYNNKIISFQIQAVDAVNEYFTTLEKKYDGHNLAELYIWLRDQLKSLQDKVALQDGRRRETILKDAVVDYISGLQVALDNYERPVVELIGAYSGSASEFYRRDTQIFSNYMTQFSQSLAKLDAQMETAQSQFSKKYKFEVEKK